MNSDTELESLIRQFKDIAWCSVEGSKIVEFYKGKNVFVTGATGFLGKLLVEKLLRACPDINAIYVLVRPKKGEDERDRVDKLYTDKLFEPLRKIFPSFQHKINIIKGDVSLPDLGLNTKDKVTINEQVHVIFHIAATVRFHEKITTATAINVRGTRDLLKIAKECHHLESFVHVSSAYANCSHREIDEVFYKTPLTADELIQMVKKVPEETLLEQTPIILRSWPNTYTFTKAIAEDAVKSFSKGLPVCLVRPAIVAATYREPLRSWIDNQYGVTGVIVGAVTGFLKTLHCDKKKAAEVVPGDYVINFMIAASYKTAIQQNNEEVVIYNYVSSVENRITWEQFLKICKSRGEMIPPVRSIWYNCLTLHRLKFVHIFYRLLLHYLPAVIMDLGMIVMRQTPTMVRTYRKITKFESIIAHFATNQWKFHNDNTQTLWNCISEADQKMFPFSMKQLDWDEYHKTYMLGLRLYLVKEDLSTLPEARKKWRRFYIANMLMKTLFYLIILVLFYSVLSKLA